MAELLGVAHQTVSSWFTSNSNDGKGSKPDARVKLNPEAKEVVAETPIDSAFDIYIDQPPRTPFVVQNCNESTPFIHVF